MITNDFKAKINIVDVISADCMLSPDGSRLSGAHSTHSSKSGKSLKVFPSQQSFYCFNCHVGGDVITYIQNRDGTSFVEALRWLSEQYNIPLPNWPKDKQEKWEQQRDEKELISAILLDAFKIYHNEMDESHRNYFRGRGLIDRTIDNELLGYAPDCDNFLFSRLHGKYHTNDLLKSGLFVKLSGKISDVYQRRYLFPYWHQSKIVYSIGRLDTNNTQDIEQLPAWNQSKYKKHLTHSDKHPYVSDTIENSIYNADSVRAFDKGIITEGMVDAQLSKQAGFGVISPVTTRFAKHDIEELCKLAKHWNTTYTINDNEISKEGEKGALDTAEAIFKDGGDVQLVTLPRPADVDKIDLADFLNVPDDQRDNRVDELHKLMDESPDFIEWKVNQAKELPDRDNTTATRDIFALLTGTSDELELNRYADIMRDAGLVRGERLFWNALKKARIAQAKKRKQEQMKHLESEAPELFLKAEIENVRKNKYSKAFEIKRDMSHIILYDMRERGRFYRTPSQQFFWFENETKTLFFIHTAGDETLGALINERYGINPSEIEYSFLLEDLKKEAILKGKETEVHKFAFYANNNHRLYVYNNADQIYCLDGKEIKLVANGTDGVLFLKDPDWESFEYKDIGNGEFLLPLVVNPINFVDGAHVNLSKDEQQIMFSLWLQTIFFESLQPTKPIQAFIGPKGSGKTTVQRIIGKTLFGIRFDVTPITKDDDFDAAVTHNYIVFFDNVDGKIGWLNDRLAHTATGKMIQKRQLYTTNELVRFYPRCFLSLNARVPKFKRDDVVDRLLLFRVERLESFRSEQSIIDDILSHRDELWSELLNQLNSIIAALAQDNEPFTSKHRMADWATLAWQIAKSTGKGDRFLEILEKMDREQNTFLLEDNSVFLCLDVWVATPNNQGREVDTSTLFKDFQTIAEKENIAFTFKNAQSMGMHLRNIISNLSEFFEITSDKKKNRWVYTFRQKC